MIGNEKLSWMKTKKKFPDFFHHKHDIRSIKDRLHEGTRHSYLKDFVYGSVDGTITTFAIVSGVVGADLQSKTILILGAANLFADGFSMAASNYLGTKTENDERNLIEEFENLHIDKYPAGEENEVRQILKEKGYSGDLLEKNTKFIVSDRKRWMNMMLSEEYGIDPNPPRSALKSSMTTFLAFVLFGSIPLISYIFKMNNPFFWASLLTGLSFTTIGSLRSKWTVESSFLSAGKTLLMGSGAAAIAYIVGDALRGVVH